MPEDGHRDSLRTACVPELVFHALAWGVHGKLLVCYDCLKALREHLRVVIRTSVFGIALKHRLFRCFAFTEVF